MGISWALWPNVVLKLEGHRMQGYASEDMASLVGPSARPRYVIGSISVGF